MGHDLGRQLREAGLRSAWTINAAGQPVPAPEDPLPRRDPLVEAGAPEPPRGVREVFEDRGRLAQVASIRVIDQERHLAEALLRQIRGRLVLALAQGAVNVVERLAGEREHEADLCRLD